jgi:hypothetical protein
MVEQIGNSSLVAKYVFLSKSMQFLLVISCLLHPSVFQLKNLGTKYRVSFCNICLKKLRHHYLILFQRLSASPHLENQSCCLPVHLKNSSNIIKE